MEKYQLRKGPKKSFCDKCHEIFNNKSDFDLHCRSHKNKDVEEESTKKSITSLYILPNERVDVDLKLYGNEIRRSVKTYGKVPVGTYKKDVESKPQRTRTHVCDVCQETLTTKAFLCEHKVTRHGFSPFTCKFCHKGFSRKNLLVKHYRSHRKPFICSLCNKQYALKVNLMFHYRTHTGEKPFTCEICQESFIIKTLLSTHMRVQHSHDDTYYTCQKCPRTFKFKSHMLIHMHSHYKDKYFVCEVCSAEFRELSSLEIHTCYTYNTEQKPFSCDICMNSFSTEIEFNQHNLTHESILP